MATLMPSSNVEAAYEDMFKEITRKLYGEETGNGLHTLGTPVAQVATTGPTAPEGERSFTNLQIDRSSAPTIEYEHNGAAAAAAAAAAGQNASVVIQQPEGGSVVVSTTGVGGNFKSEDHLSTAFGLAALMQNGFTTTGTILSTQAINKVVTNAGQSSSSVADPTQQQRWSAADGSTDPQQQPQIVQWTTGGKLQSYTNAQQQQQQQQQVSTPKSKSKSRHDNTSVAANSSDVIYTSPSTSVANANQSQQQQQQQTTPTTSTTGTGSTGGGNNSRKKSSNSNNQAANNGGVQIQKRYACTHCPYSTDRRDLYTRHENIHKDEKPFQCYACLKQFNRADHVKKHFLRMHRELQYDINKTRRHVPSSSASATAAAAGGGRSNLTLASSVNTSNSSGGSPEQKPNIFHAANVQLDNAFLEGQRQPTSSSMSIAETIEAVASAADAPLPQMKQEKADDGSVAVGGGGGGSGSVKPKREKRFSCCYCPWSGADKWGLKRHLNTHTKPYVCLLCDYKAARAERLSTHVLKVHNKKACNKCSFLADTQEEFQAHLSDVHGTTTNSSSNANSIGNAGSGGGGGSVTIYTTTTTNDNGSIAGGPLQEIIVNPTSMVGWRLSANGSLIPPHELLTGGLPNAAAQKRGSERLFQYLEADGSDPEDYARLLKMDAISRNTASVAQDFHKAGGVHELKIPANHQLLFNNKLPSQWTTKEAAALLHSLSKGHHHHHNNNNNKSSYQQRSKLSSSYGNYYQHHGLRQRQHSTGEDDENTPSSASSTTSSDGMSPIKLNKIAASMMVSPPPPTTTMVNAAVTTTTNNNKLDQRKAMSAFLSKNFGLQEIANEFTASSKSQSNSNSNSSSNNKRKLQQQQQHPMQHDQYHDHDVEDQENQQLIKSPPAYKQISNTNNLNNKQSNNISSNNNNINSKRSKPNQQQQQLGTTKANNNSNATTNNINANSREHRLDLIRDNKENSSAALIAAMEYQGLNKLETQFQNYVKDIINKYYAAESPLLYPAMPTATTTGQHQSQSQSQKQQQQPQPIHQSPKRKRMLSETEEYIEYLKNKEDITLTITPKAGQKHQQQQPQQQVSPLKRQLDLRRPSPKKTTSPTQQVSQPPSLQIVANNNNNNNNTKSRKSLSQLATLLPLLADAASQQQYLTTPLDFSKKQSSPEAKPKATDAEKVVVSENCSNSNSSVSNTNANSNCSSNFESNITTNSMTASPSCADKRSSRKQAQPKKIRTPPEVVIAMLRDKYLNRMVDHKLSCGLCSNSHRSTMLVFNYHTKGSLALHRHWKHRERASKCAECGERFARDYSRRLHCRREHQPGSERRVRMSAVKEQQPLKEEVEP